MGKGLNSQISAMVHVMDTLHMKGKLFLYLFWNTILWFLAIINAKIEIIVLDH
jgi:hypothetical protein